MIKVLYVSPNGFLGGAERFVVTSAIGHKEKNNIDVGILFFSEGEASIQAKQCGINCFVLGSVFRLRNPWKLFLALLEIRKIVIKFNPDILHLTMPYSQIVLSLAAVGLGIKKVWFQHGPVGGRLDQLANLFPVDMIWYNSNDLKEHHHKTWPKANVRILETIINLGVKSISKERKLFIEKQVNLGTAGRICSWKGFHHIVLALGELKRECSLKTYKLSIAGTAKKIHDKEYEQELRALVLAQDLAAEVIFLGHIENMDEFYQGLDVFIHSSVIPEPFGLVVAEAMANNCLVIGSNSGGVSEMLIDGKTGITFSSTSEQAIQELKQKLKEVLNNDHDKNAEIFITLANQGKRYIEQNFSIEKMIVNIEDLYGQLHKK